MKSYKKVEMVAKNAPSGSYFASCPQYRSGTGANDNYCEAGSPMNSCRYCECSK